jgi:hypothetical protein
MDNLSFFRILMYISIASILLPNIGGIIVFRRLDAEGKKILFFFGTFFLVELAIACLAFQKINNMPIFNILTPIEYGFYAYLFYTNTIQDKVKKGIKYASIFFFVFAIFALFFIRSIMDFNSETRVLEALLLVFFSLVYFSELSKSIQSVNTNIYKIPMFWMGIGILFYFTGNFFLFLMYREVDQISPTLWSIHSIINISSNLLFMFSFLCRLK